MDWVNVTERISGLLWGRSLIAICLIAGIYFSAAMKFPQIRYIKQMIQYLVRGESSKRGMSSFQSFAMALGGKVGTGNIAGVATAIYFGGPGAVFWMWMIAFLGAGSAIAESTLAQTYKEEVAGEYRGGPAYYIEKGLKNKPFAILFAIATIIACGITGPTIQAHNIAISSNLAFGISKGWITVIVVALFSLVVFGGMKRIGRFAEIVVPFMAVMYIGLAVIIISLNISNVPSMFGLIFTSAFNMNATFGGIFGSAIMWGVRRGVYSSEAGMGSSAQASAAAEVSHPVKQGLAQAFSVYIDTLFLCTATALMILSTGAYNVVDGSGEMIVSNVPDIAAGTGYTQSAIDSLFPGFGAGFVAIAMFFFAFTTLLSFAFYADSNIAYIFKGKKSFKAMAFGVKVLLVVMIVIGSTRSSALAWNLADIGVGLMAWVNLVAILLLNKKVLVLFKDFERQVKMGVNPVFNPEDCNLGSLPLWQEKFKKERRDTPRKKKREKHSLPVREYT